jgi:ankyrin repeat protein
MSLDDPENDSEQHVNPVARRALLRQVADRGGLKYPPTSTPSLMKFGDRPCGERHLQVLNEDKQCQVCGGPLVHETVRKVGQHQHTRLELNQRDFYDNTSLFFYAMSRNFTVEGLKALLASQADMMIQNSSGASFMHYYHWAQHTNILWDLDHFTTHSDYDEIIELLEFLAARNFPFSHRNEHGQTVAHLLCEYLYQNGSGNPTTQQIDRLLTALNTDIDALDNQGRCIGQWLDLLFQNSTNSSEIKHYEALCVKLSPASSLNSGNLMLDLKKLCIATLSKGQYWPTVVETLRYSQLIDSKGDSPLIAMLKVCDSDGDVNKRLACVESLVKLGIGINLKDRRGNTALVIAARRGFRATVQQLLGKGANPNSVNYHGRSVLYMTKGWLKMAKRIDGKEQYARIASCIPVLQQSNAVFEPSLHQQRLSATARQNLKP